MGADRHLFLRGWVRQGGDVCLDKPRPYVSTRVGDDNFSDRPLLCGGARSVVVEVSFLIVLCWVFGFS